MKQRDLQAVNIQVPPIVLALAEQFRVHIDAGVSGDKPHDVSTVLGAALVLILAWVQEQPEHDQAIVMASTLKEFTNETFAALGSEIFTYSTDAKRMH
jgi:hypothetical protein